MLRWVESPAWALPRGCICVRQGMCDSNYRVAMVDKRRSSRKTGRNAEWDGAGGGGCQKISPEATWR